ncbi:transmembrane and coiled-coil domain-containing protein 4-like [Prunus yedoensis var. nudiflora]|uniref:Transmembrane and coiled-coil domain-containing protein 4-like n=1 Tax=Prunus yedoensis var. nudiflora TaxID=2094558 RepID=A0A314ZDU2_PRUYE|nr:transmembrane and coiled-coil domain-containing protein 4-like [Prunus yedoensis var. nudiflora]
MATTSFLTPTQRYAAGALFAFALHQAQIHQTHPLRLSSEEEESTEERTSSVSSADSVSDGPELWVHENSGLLRPVFRFLEIDSAAWSGLQESAATSPASHHVGAFLRLLAEEGGDGDKDGSQSADQELALSRTVDAMALSMEKTSESSQSKKEKHREYENECREKFSTAEVKKNIEAADEHLESPQEKRTTAEVKQKIEEQDVQLENLMQKCSTADVKQNSEGVGALLENQQDTGGNLVSAKDALAASSEIREKTIGELTMLSYQRKVTVLYELLSACLADKREDNKKCTRRRKGYDARHRVALRLLATWLDVKWMKMEAIETMVACSAMALVKKEKKKKKPSHQKANGLNGSVVFYFSTGLAAPAIAAGLGALAPTLGTLIPVIGASGFAAAASAAGTVAGSVVVAASFGAAGAGLTGSKMARRTGSVDEFEFSAIGENHNQGRLAVEILVSGFVFDKEDFVRPWEGQDDNLERYALVWESKNLIAVSTAIQDWLTSRIAMGLMKQGAMMTVLGTLVTALAWPATLLAAADFIDSKWAIAVDRSDKAGRLLAEVLLKGIHGNRPVTLVGFSLGARVIFKCLQCLAETEKNAELVERVVLLGAPISIADEKWEAARKMVAGRFVNAYSTNDWMLGIAFRASLLSRGLAGIQPIKVEGIENVDVTDVIDAHSSYLWGAQQILDLLELEAYYPVFRSTICIQ